MGVMDHPENDRHRSVFFHRDPATGLSAIIAVHRKWDRPCVGGCRFWSYADEGEALADVLRLSRGMTYKCVMAGADYGGSKCVILKPDHLEDRTALFESMGTFVESLGGLVKTGMDVGLTQADVAAMARRSQHIVGTGDYDPADVTAQGVFEGMKATVRHMTGGDDLTGLKVAIQGVGKIGMKLCEHLYAAGATAAVSDVNAEAVQQAKDRFGSETCQPDRILAADADILSPCALGGVLDLATVDALRVRAIVGAANNQLATDEIGERLSARGILYAPDYISNAGGLIAVLQDIEGFSADEMDRRVAHISDSLVEVYETAARENVSTVAAANAIANRRIAERNDRLGRRYGL